MLNTRDEAAFRALYARHSPALYALALRLLADRPHDADDVLQECWLRAVARLQDFAWRSQLRTWLTSILINCCRELWRASREELYLDDTEAIVPNEDTGVSVDVARALAKLPTGYRAVLVLHDIAGFTHAEIGERLEIEPGTSKSQLSRARRSMRLMLDPTHIRA